MKRFLLWLAGSVSALLALFVLALQLSPWPSVWLIRQVFARGDQASQAALEKHVPAGIVSRLDVAYGAGPDEVFDINSPPDVHGPRPAIVWVHGGGWIAGSKAGVANYLEVLAGHGYVTVGVEYSKGGSSTYPEPVRQVNAALAHLVQHAAEFGIDPQVIVLAGDSAGAQIAAQLAITTTDAAYAARLGIFPALAPERLRAVLLLSGAYDISATTDRGLMGWFVNTVLWAYSGTRDYREDERFQLLSVTQHVTSAFPRSFISSGNGDPLAPQAVALVQRLGGLGVAVDSLFFPADYAPALPHEYQFNLDTPAGQEALRRMLAFLAAVRSGA